MISILFITILTPLTIYAIALLIHVYSTQPRQDEYLRDRKGRFISQVASDKHERRLYIMRHTPKMYVIDHKNSWVGHEPVYKKI